MSEYDDSHIVWYGVTALFGFTEKYTAALRAYGNIYGDKRSNDTYIELANEAIWRQLLSEISKIYDKDSTCGNDNCSMKRLQFACMNDSKSFPDGSDDELLRRISDLYDRYERILSKELRNKKLAHYDLENTFSSNIAAIPFDSIEEFVKDTSMVLSKIGERLFGFETSFSYSELIKSYEEALHNLATKRCPT